VGPVD